MSSKPTPTYEEGLKQGRAEVLVWLREHGGFIYADDYLADNPDKVDPCEHQWRSIRGTDYEECLKCAASRPKSGAFA